MSIELFARDGIWYLRGTFQGTHVYKTTGTRDRAIAEGLRTVEEKAILARLLDPDGVKRGRHPVPFAKAADHYLNNGKKPRSKRTVKLVGALKAHFADKLLAEIDQSELDTAFEELAGNEVKASTKRRKVSGPLIAVLNHAAKRKWCDVPVFELPTVEDPPTVFFEPRQALALIDAAAPHLKPLLIVMFGTGARVSEALYLDWAHVDLAAARVRFVDTKSGEPRVAGLPPASVAALANLPHRSGMVFRRDDGEAYAVVDGYGGQIKTAWGGACRRAGLIEAALNPDGTPAFDDACRPKRLSQFTPHCTRHSWATWFYALSRNFLLLKHEGGWAEDKMVTRYAHLMRSDLEVDVALVWGGPHPAIPAPAPTQPREAARG